VPLDMRGHFGFNWLITRGYIRNKARRLEGNRQGGSSPGAFLSYVAESGLQDLR